jgi:isoleucyl-tRNA synthetase
MISVAVRNAAPYKTVITHGFVVDTTGKKISKSEQGAGGKNEKPMTADHYYNTYGADMVRLWVSSVDYQSEVPFSQKLFEQTGESYRRIRNTLRVLLGNLHDYEPVAQPAYTLVDRWILERLHDVTQQCVAAYAEYDFRKVFTVVNQFLAVDLSSLYIDITKDRLYCDAKASPRRRAAQSAIRQVTETLCRLLAPIIAFTADEAWEHLGFKDSVHLQQFPQPDPAFAGNEATQAVEELLQARVAIGQAIEPLRQAKKIGSSLEATVQLTLPSEGLAHPVWEDAPTLAEFFILSGLHLKRGDSLSAVVEESSHCRCGRCWKHLPEVKEEGALCARCEEAVGS